MAKTHGYSRDPKTGKVTVTNETPTRGAANSAKGREGDFQKDGLGSRVVDGILKKLGK